MPRPAVSFQSSIAPKGNRYKSDLCQHPQSHRVPILDRPERQSLRGFLSGGEKGVRWFQSSIAPKGNRYHYSNDERYQISVPILDRPERQSLPGSVSKINNSSAVPILDRPERQSLPTGAGKTACFSSSNPRSPRKAIATQDFGYLPDRNICSNPRSPRKAIATSWAMRSLSLPVGSNPRSPRKAIATTQSHDHFGQSSVPILDRPERQSLRGASCIAISKKFQSSIAPKGNRYPVLARYPVCG